MKRRSKQRGELKFAFSRFRRDITHMIGFSSLQCLVWLPGEGKKDSDAGPFDQDARRRKQQGLVASTRQFPGSVPADADK